MPNHNRMHNYQVQISKPFQFFHISSRTQELHMHQSSSFFNQISKFFLLWICIIIILDCFWRLEEETHRIVTVAWGALMVKCGFRALEAKATEVGCIIHLPLACTTSVSCNWSSKTTRTPLPYPGLSKIDCHHLLNHYMRLKGLVM